ncbi:MAG: hypothetical protein LLG00_06710 [Planctomycetaceae bacterium]|nr:hypothetical protein [Planctomycetaceae bacterium]
MSGPVVWPDGKRFAFTIFDDTDGSTLDNVGSVYSFLADQGFRTTKSCWVFNGDRSKGKHPGETLDDERYRRWLVGLHKQGFEIGWHGATWHGSPRERTAEAFDRFMEIFGENPRTGANHASNGECIYWGSARLTDWRQSVYNILTRYRNYSRFRGHIEGDEHFWGDLCQSRIKYYRNFVYQDVNTLKMCPFMPYHDPAQPDVNFWFCSSDGDKVDRFNRCLSEAAQDRLEAEGGACIMYTHFAWGFGDNGRIQPRFKWLMERLAKKGGWFVPVATMLDYLQKVNGQHEITRRQRRRMERKWLWQKLFVGTD